MHALYGGYNLHRFSDALGLVSLCRCHQCFLYFVFLCIMFVSCGYVLIVMFFVFVNLYMNKILTRKKNCGKDNMPAKQ